MNTTKSNPKVIDSEQIKQIKVLRLQKRLILITVIVVLVLTAIWLAGTHNISVYGNALPIGQVLGNSMEPTYHAGEWVTYYTPDKKPIEAGSVIIYSKAITRKLVMHRVVYINSDGSLVTKGDNIHYTDFEMLINSRNVTLADVEGIVGGPLKLWG